MKKLHGSLFSLSILILALICYTQQQSTPTIGPENPLLNGQTNYIVSYFAFRQFQTSSFFQIDFSQADIIITNGQLNVTASLNGTSVNQNSITANCTNKVCTVRLNTAFPVNTNLQIIFGQVRNPKYSASQRINVFIYFGVNLNQTQTVTISSSVYLPMPVTINSIWQSDYGVGTQQVTYIFNVSFTYIPKDPQILIQIPSQVGYKNLETELSFYGTVQNINPFLTSNMIIFSLKVDQILIPNGSMLLTLKGFRNPRFIGTSTSFNISMVQKKIPSSNNCVSCRVAYLYSNSSKLLSVSSTTPGDITTNMFNPSSLYVWQRVNLTIGIKIVAPIPQGGKFRIILPSAVVPSMPIACEAIHGFIVATPSYCVYNQTSNTIQTVNFSIPYLEQTGDAIIRISIINPKDNRLTKFDFQTLDEQNRKIGKSRQPYIYSALPLALNASAYKSLTQLDSNFTLSSNLTLAKTLNKTTDSILVILPPSQSYNLTSIQCISSNLQIACTKQLENYTNNLLIKLSPPCSVCNASAVISFKIINLVNPSFINDEMQRISIQTLTGQGVIETFSANINLKEKLLVIQRLDWDGKAQVGSQYKLKVKYEVPRYIQTHGGFLLINFDANSTYVDVLINGTSYSYPQSLKVLSENGQSLQNTLTYYEDSKPKSLRQIKVKLCTNDSFCANNLTISALRKSFSPASSSSQSFKATTLFGQPVSTSIRDVSAFMPQLFSNQLIVYSALAATNQISSYVFKFSMNKMPFESGLKIQLSTKHKIQDNGRCFVEIMPLNSLGYALDCQVLNNTTVGLTYAGDLTLMTANVIQYTVTVVNVLNPPSIMPITYKIQTQLSSLKTGIFSTSYAMAQTYNLSVEQIMSSNLTYGQATSVSVKLKSGYYPFDQLRIFVPKQNFKSLSSFNGAALISGPSQGFGFTENSTHFALDKIYSIGNYTLALQLVNAYSTIANAKILIQMYVQGYLSSKGTFGLPKIQPVYLFSTVLSQNRFVGEPTSLAFQVKRTNPFIEQKTLKITFDSKLLSIQSTNQTFTLEPGSTDLYSFMDPISSWTGASKSIVLNSLINMKFIPNNQTLQTLPKILILTLDSNNSVVSRSSINLSQVVPNSFKDSLSYTFTRTSTQSGNYTDIVIDFKARYPQKSKLLRIDLPQNQNKLSSETQCLVGSTSQTNCSIYERNLKSLTVQFPANQNRVTLKKVINLFQSQNNLTMTLMTQANQLIEQSSKSILPKIDYDPLQMSATANSSDIAQTVKLDLIIKQIQNDIVVGSKLKLTFPQKVYTKILSLNSKDCEYQIGGAKYSGCQYVNDLQDDGREWLQYVYINNLGPTPVPAGSIVRISLYLTNPWTAYLLSQRNINAQLFNSLGQYISKGMLPLSSIYSTLNSFTASTLSSYTLQQTSKICNSENQISLNIKLPINLAKNSYLHIILPSSTYGISPQTGLTIQSQDQSFIHVKKLISQCSASFPNATGLCVRSNTNIAVLLKVTNDKYLQLADTTPKLKFYLINENSSVVYSIEMALENRIPSQVLALTLERSTGNISDQVTSKLKYTLGSTFNLSNTYKFSIAPVNSIIPFIQQVSISQFKVSGNILLNSESFFQQSYNNSQFTLAISYTPTQSVQIQIRGTNPLFVPNLPKQQYVVRIYNNNYIYHTNTVTLSEQSRLKPISQGIQIKRSNSYVDTIATYTVTGSLPRGVNYGRIIFNQTTVSPAASMTYFKDLKMGEFLNPKSSNWDTYESISIMNDTHVLYRNNRVKTTPQLQSLELLSNAVSYIGYKSEMRINTEQKLFITFANSSLNFSTLIIRLPTFFKQIKKCKLESQQPSSGPNFKILTSTQSQTSIQVSIPSNTVVSTIQFTFVTLQYQRAFSNDSITIQTQYPTKSLKKVFSVNVYGVSLQFSLSMSSYKVNRQSQIQLKITPISRNNTILTVYFPSYSTYQLKNLQETNSTTSAIKFVQNSAQKPISIQYNKQKQLYYFNYLLTSFNAESSFVLTVNKLDNPLTNEPYYFIIEQKAAIAEDRIFGHSKAYVIMNVLEEIFIRSTVRNTSKIGVNVDITIQIQIPITIKSNIIDNLTLEECLIQLPAAQVVRSTGKECQVYLVNGTSQTKLPCLFYPQIQNSIVTLCSAGLNKYSIRKGFMNMLYSVIPDQNQKPYALIGLPYQMAQTNTQRTTFLTPLLTSGSLNLNKISSSSMVRLQKTTLNLNMTLQNIQQVDCVNFNFQREHYIIRQSDLKCRVNLQIAECWSSSPGSVMVNISKIGSKDVGIEINGLTNYLRQGNFTIKTLKYLGIVQSAANTPGIFSRASSPSHAPVVSTFVSVKSAPLTSFAMIDIFYSSLNDFPTPFVSNFYQFRIINPNNYVSQQLKKIEVIFEDQSKLPEALQKTKLGFNLTSNIQNCSLVNLEYAVSLTLMCKFGKQMNFQLQVELFHKQYRQIQLSSKTFSSYIYPELKDNCQNQMCNKCSQGPNVQEKCFQCRQNYFEHMNGCIQTCPYGYTKYQQSMTCQKCSSDCQTCFGLYSNNCLKCSSPQRVSQDGRCLKDCLSGYGENGYCLGNDECFSQGCRSCSTSGFCYQCLPEYSGEPTCQWQSMLPPVMMTYFTLSFIAYAIFSSIYFLIRRGATVLTYQLLFSFSLVEFAAWCFIIPALHSKQQAMLILSMIVFRIVTGIVAYETYYKKQISKHIGLNQEQSLLQKQKSLQKSQNNVKTSQESSLHFEQTWKSRLIRFLAQTNGIDSYEAFKVLFSKELKIQHNNLYLWIMTGNRVLVCLLMFYVLSQGKIGDLTFLPILIILSTFIVVLLRVLKSNKFQECWNKIRNTTKN